MAAHRPSALGARAARSLIATALAVVGLVVVAPPANASVAPWRFVEVVSTLATVNAGAIAGGHATCPDGYVPIGGGLHTFYGPDSAFERVAEYRYLTNSYRVVIHNYHSSAVDFLVTAWCALGSQVGSLTLKTSTPDFARDAQGEAGGVVDCGAGNRALFGGADWNGSGSTRRVDVMSPTTDGQGWYVAGWSPTVGDSLHVEAWCIPASSLGSASLVTATQSVSEESIYSLPLSCPAGTRAGQGGVIGAVTGNGPDPSTYTLGSLSSAPSISGPRSWALRIYAWPNTTATGVLWCLPASTVSTQIVQHSAALSNSSTATFTYTVTEATGETVTSSCVLDDGSTGATIDVCSPGVQATISGVPAGLHTLTVTVANDSGSEASAQFAFTVDQSAPHVSPQPGVVVPVSGSIPFGFDEAVTGVGGGSVQMTLTDSGAGVPGSVSYDSGTRTARWSPTKPLVPGEHYTLALSPAITDLAGNPLAVPTSFALRATTTVENSSPALVERWDPDTSNKARGGGFAVSPAAGSTLTWTVKTSAGQRASLFGVRTPRGGYADVRVDGVRKQKLSFYAASPRYGEKLFTTAALKAGTHTVQLKVLGKKPAASSGTEVAADALVVGSKVSQETAARQVFRRVAAAHAYGGSYDVVTHRRKGDTGGQPTYVLTFRGTGVTVYAAKLPTSGKAEFVVDGVSKGTVSLHSTTAKYRVAVFNLAGLPDKRHTLQVICRGTRSGTGSAVALDRISIMAPAIN